MYIPKEEKFKRKNATCMYILTYKLYKCVHYNVHLAFSPLLHFSSLPPPSLTAFPSSLII